jgi:hypothetical protein
VLPLWTNRFVCSIHIVYFSKKFSHIMLFSLAFFFIHWNLKPWGQFCFFEFIWTLTKCPLCHDHKRKKKIEDDIWQDYQQDMYLYLAILSFRYKHTKLFNGYMAVYSFSSKSCFEKKIQTIHSAGSFLSISHSNCETKMYAVRFGSIGF